jgi:NADPH:quinone reductase-like Zn-dependent oxidoreductase
MTATMTAAHGETGKPLTLIQRPLPQPRPGEILIEVAAAGLNRADLAQRAGRYPPPPGASDILGLEVSGIVSALGSGASRFKAGDRVCALLAGGGYASHVAVDEGSVLPVPDHIDLVTAACFPEAMMTAWANVFDRAGLKPGETFLCHGATSGIGVMAIQMTKVYGASKIFGTAGSDEKCALARDLGADIAINYRTEDFDQVV